MTKKTYYQILAPSLEPESLSTSSEKNLINYDRRISNYLPQVKNVDSAEILSIYQTFKKTSDILHGTYKVDGKSVSRTWKNRASLLQQTQAELVELVESAYKNKSIDAIGAKNLLEVFDQKVQIKTTRNSYVRGNGLLDLISPVFSYNEKHSNNYLNLAAQQKAPSKSRELKVEQRKTSKAQKELVNARRKNQSLAGLLMSSKLTQEGNEVSTARAIQETSGVRSQLEEALSQITNYNAQVHRYRLAHEELTVQYESAMAKVKDAENHTAQLNISLTSLERRLSELTTNLNTSQVEVDKLKQESADKTRSIKQKDEQISTLNEESTKYQMLAKKPRYGRAALLVGATAAITALVMYGAGCFKKTETVVKDSDLTAYYMYGKTPKDVTKFFTSNSIPTPVANEFVYEGPKEVKLQDMSYAYRGDFEKSSAKAVEISAPSQANVSIEISPVVTNVGKINISDSVRPQLRSLENSLTGFTVYSDGKHISAGSVAYVANKNRDAVLESNNFDSDKFAETNTVQNLKQLAADLAPLRHKIYDYKNKEYSALNSEMINNGYLTADELNLLEDAEKLVSGAHAKLFDGIPFLEKIPLLNKVSLPWRTKPGRTVKVGGAQ